MAGRPIRLVLVDDQDLLRDGVRRILSDEPDIDVIGEGQDGDDAVALAQKKPDVMLLDADLPGAGPEVTVPLVYKVSPMTRVILLADVGRPVVAQSLMELRPSVRGYLVKDVGGTQLIGTIHTVMQGKRTLVASSVRSLAGALVEFGGHVKSAPPVLTAREREVLTLVASGMTNREVAVHLFITTGTVHNHLSSVYAKLDVANRLEAVNRAVHRGLIAPNDASMPPSRA